MTEEIKPEQNDVTTMEKEKPKLDDVVGRPLGWKAPEDSIEDYESFIYRETPFYKSHVIAEALHEASAAIMADKQGSSEVREAIKQKAVEYYTKNVLEAKIGTGSMTKNLSLKYMFETATGLTDEDLADLFADGKDITSDVLMKMGNDMGRTYDRWAGQMMMSNLRAASKTEKGRTHLESKVNSWNDEFKLGLKMEDLKDKEKLQQAYLSGAGRNQEYLSTQGQTPYRP